MRRPIPGVAGRRAQRAASLLWLGITALALIYGSKDYGRYLLPVVLCSIFGALARRARPLGGLRGRSRAGVPAPLRGARRLATGITLIGGIMLLCAAFSSLVAFLGPPDWKFSKTTPEVSEPVAVASGGAGQNPSRVWSWKAVVEERPLQGG